MTTLRTCHRRQTGKASPNHHAQSSPILLSPSPLFSLLHLSFLPPPRFFLGVDKRRRHHRIATLKASQHRQTEMASPNAYAENPPAWTNGEDIPTWLRPEPLSAAKRRQHHHMTTLRTCHRRQTGKASPNHHAQSSPILLSPSPLFPSSIFLFSSPSPLLPRRRQTETTPPNRYTEGQSA